MIRFPQVIAGTETKGFLVFNNRPYARHNYIPVAEDSKKVGFLTETTIFFVLSGEKRFYFDDHFVGLKAGQIMILKKGIYTMSEYVTENEPFEALMIFVPDTFLQTLQLHGATSRDGIEHQKEYSLISSTSILESFKTHYLQYFRKPIESMEALLQLKLKELLLLLLSGVEKDRTSNFLRTIVASRPLDIEYVVKTYQFQPITLQELATLSGRSLASFKRDFQQKYNSPPRQWINNQRLSHAKKSLLNSNKQVAEVAYECGFENPSHFIKLFKKRFGVTPSMLRTEGAMI